MNKRTETGRKGPKHLLLADLLPGVGKVFQSAQLFKKLALRLDREHADAIVYPILKDRFDDVLAYSISVQYLLHFPQLLSGYLFLLVAVRQKVLRYHREALFKRLASPFFPGLV